MMRLGCAVGCAAFVCFSCGSDGSGTPAGKGGAAGRGGHAPDGGGATSSGGMGRAGAGGGGGRSGGAGGQGGTGGDISAGGGSGGGRDASVDVMPGPEAGTDAGPTDGGATVGEWPLQLPDSGVCTVQGFCWEAPVPLGNSLASAWGSGPNDVWFAGHLDTGTIAHWDGASLRGLTGLVSEWGSSVTGTSAKDVWVLGGPHALHYDGKEWSRLSPGTDKALAAAHAVTTKLAFAVGEAGTIVRWDGTSWAPFGSGTTEDLKAVWAFSDKDVWIAGNNAYHWNGTSWSSAPACGAFWGDTASDLFCVRAGVALARYDGTKWTDVGPLAETPARGLWGTGPSDVVVLARGSTYRYDGKTFALASARGGVSYSANYPQAVGLWAAGANDYWATTPRVDTAPGSLFRFQGTAWAPVGTNLAPGAITCTNQSTAFVGSGIAWTAYSDPSLGNKLARWDGTTYTEYPPGTDKPLRAISVLSAVDVWVSAEGGDVTHWNGTNWTASNVGATVALSSLYAASAGSVWAGGEAGNIYEYDGANWVDRSVKMDALAALWGTSPTDVWAVGDRAYHYTTDWKAVDLPAAFPRLVAMWGHDPSDLRAMALSADSPSGCATTCESACEGAVLKWNGSEFSILRTGAPACGTTPRPVFASFYSFGTSAWATDGRYAYHWDDVTFSQEILPGDPTDLACGVGSDGQQVLVAGPYPLLRRKNL